MKECTPVSNPVEDIVIGNLIYVKISHNNSPLLDEFL
ncbi:MAG: hypothetical protein ACJAXI_000244 [Crocinitomicaceae bacterium]|jgi:hypothetical protein